ncbi:MAG TPA: right-handed parallel beta-helix repeat-containing protein [Thermoanaerobaculia bacterium]|nr:right-handed parallel beta-helix repeat-containing protein [Thermoanaerobaculia bacterium]
MTDSLPFTAIFAAFAASLAATAGDAPAKALPIDRVALSAAATACPAGPTALCIDDQPGDRRWQVTVSFHTAQGGGFSGSGNAVPLVSLGVAHGGLFWFFSGDNPEILVKVLNGCAVNRQFWVFYGATTNVGFTIEVTDTRTGRGKSYANQDGAAAPPLQDTAAFSCAAGEATAPTRSPAANRAVDRALAEELGAWVRPAPPHSGGAPQERPDAQSGCAAGATTLCVDGRFQIQASFHTAEGGGRSGSGQAIGLQSLGVAQGGLFWFFGADNPEILVKVLDGCAVNNRFWVFYAASTNVAFTLTVTDTQTAGTRTYQNSDGTAAPPVQDTAALPCGASSILYVAVDGQDTWSGILAAPNASHTDGPFASLARAQQAVRALAGTRAVTVEVRAGTYYLPLSPTNPGTLTFVAADSGTASLPIAWQNYPGETAIVSGGVPVGNGGLGLTWTQSGSSNLWQVQLPAASQNFEYLFYTAKGDAPGGGGTRRLRARLESPNGVGYYMNGSQCTSVDPIGPPAAVPTSLCSLGTYLRVAGAIPQSGSTCSVANSMADGKGHTKCLDRFYYNPADPIRAWVNLNGTYTGNPVSPCQANPANPYPVGDVALTLYEAWTVDAMRIGCIDTTNHIIYLTGPAKRSGANVYNLFGPGAGKRYLVENAKDAFTLALNAGQTGLWFLDRSTAQPVLSYIANAGENPNSDIVVIPQLGGAIPGEPATDYVGGSLISATNLSYVTFQGIIFEVDDFFPSTTGFNNDDNGELALPQAIGCEGCQHVVFGAVTVRHTSASGILVASSAATAQATNDLIQGSTFYDIGDSGVRIGHLPRRSDTAADVVTNVTVQNNLIQGYSRVFADGEGIAQGNGNGITYLHNDILDGYHAGISICNLGCPGAAANVNGTNIFSQYNHIRNIMQGITSDGGTLYYNVGGPDGSGTGNKIYNNLVHDTTDSSIIDPVINGKPSVPGSGYGGQGIYLDAQSGGVDVKYNVVYHMSSFAISLTEGPTVSRPANPNLFENNIFSLARRGMFAQGTPWPAGCGPSPGLQVELWWNIFNFDLDESPASLQGFAVQTGCTNSCGLDYDHFQDFEGNAYWRSGTPTTGYPLFCDDGNAFRVLRNPPPDGSCTAGGQSVFLTFDSPVAGSQTWQHGLPSTTPVPMNEDLNGTCSWNPNFGTSGNPSDYLLTGGPPTQFNSVYTNDTINNAGRTSGPHALASVPATFPTYTYSSF